VNEDSDIILPGVMFLALLVLVDHIHRDCGGEGKKGEAVHDVQNHQT